MYLNLCTLGPEICTLNCVLHFLTLLLYMDYSLNCVLSPTKVYFVLCTLVPEMCTLNCVFRQQYCVLPFVNVYLYLCAAGPYFCTLVRKCVLQIVYFGPQMCTLNRVLRD